MIIKLHYNDQSKTLKSAYSPSVINTSMKLKSDMFIPLRNLSLNYI